MASPTMPFEEVSSTNEPETDVGSSTAWEVTVAPPMLTVSVPTIPAEDEPSPYVMLYDCPSNNLKVEDLSGLYNV